VKPLDTVRIIRDGYGVPVGNNVVLLDEMPGGAFLFEAEPEDDEGPNVLSAPVDAMELVISFTES
jgi:hypothetical protein